MRARGLFLFFLLFLSTSVVWMGEGRAFGAEDFMFPVVTGEGIQPAQSPEQVVSVLKTVAMLTFLTLAPSLLILTTCFTRVVIVLSFLRRALATQTLPPDQVLVGLALFLTVFIMSPTWRVAWENGVKPYMNSEKDPETGRSLSTEEMLRRVAAPHRAFMFACLEANDGKEEVYFFMRISGNELDPDVEFSRDKMPIEALVPAFITSELKRAFWMGFLLYLPFLVLDVVIASVLMSMGMMMLPPVMISLPFKIILFVLVDGWRLLMEGLVTSFPASVVNALPVVA